MSTPQTLRAVHPKAPRLHPITRERYERAKTWAESERAQLERFSCCPRVFLVVAALMEEDDGFVSGPLLSRALTTKRVIDLALDLLTEIGVDCDDCDRAGVGAE